MQVLVVLQRLSSSAYRLLRIGTPATPDMRHKREIDVLPGLCPPMLGAVPDIASC
jgi:hypothetical protein